MPTPRRPDARETRRKLLRAGRSAFARRGLAGTNLRDDVLGPSGVSVGSFYHQFADKTELLLEVLAEAEPRRGRARERAVAGGPGAEALLEGFFRGVLTWARRNRELWRIAARERFGHDVRVRRALARDRAAWVEALTDALMAPSTPRGLRRDPAGLAEVVVRLAEASADADLLGAGRGRSDPSRLAAFALAGARRLPAPGATRSGGR